MTDKTDKQALYDKLDVLRRALSAYEDAHLGDLNRTADELADAAKTLGYRHGDGPLRVWAQRLLQESGLRDHP